MPIGGSWALAVAWASLGPPTLPPLPGEQAPPTAEPDAPTDPDGPATPGGPSTPGPGGTPTPRRPAPPELPPPSPTPPDAGPRATVPVEARATPGPGQPEVIDPPQPEPRGPAVEPSTKAPAVEGPGAAPRMDATPREHDDRRPLLRLPPPQRPAYSGVGLFVGSGVTFAAALSEQIVAHVLVKRRCIDPFDDPIEDPMDPGQAQSEAEDLGSALLRCAPGVLPAVVLRVQSDLALLGTIGLATAGAVLRAQRRAYDDVFGDRPARPMMGLRVAGISLIGTGVVTWLTTGALSWGLLATCRDTRCAARARLMAFTTRDAGAVLIAAGSGMLGYALAHRRAYDRFVRDRALSVGTTLLPGGAGLSLSGRF